MHDTVRCLSSYLLVCTQAHSGRTSVRVNVCNNSKNVKSHFVSIFKKNVKKRKKRTYNSSWLFNVYYSPSLLSESDTAQRSHSMFSNCSEWITFADLGSGVDTGGSGGSMNGGPRAPSHKKFMQENN